MTWKTVGILAALTALLGLGSGLARMNVTEVSGDIRLHVQPGPSALIRAALPGKEPVQGPYRFSNSVTLEFFACCVENPNKGDLTFEWDFDYDGITFTPDASGKGPILHTFPAGPYSTYVALKISSSLGGQSFCVEKVIIDPAATPTSWPAPTPTAAPSATPSVPTATPTPGPSATPTPTAIPASPTPTPVSSPTATPSPTPTAPATATPTPSPTPGFVTASYPSGADTYVNQNTPAHNMGGLPVMYVTSTKTGNADTNTRALVRFDLSAIPQGATVQSAHLKLRMDVAPSASRTYEAHRVTESWTESAVTWSNQPGAATLASDSIATGTASNVWLTWNVTADVQAFVSGASVNNGWRIRDQVESATSTYYSRFITREDAGVFDPVLVVTYSQ